MDNSNQDINFTNNQAISPEDAKASLGLATRLSEQLLMSQMMQAPMAEETQKMPQGEEPMMEEKETAPMDTEGLKNEIMASVKDEIKDIVQSEMSSLRQEIKDALSDED